MGMAIKRRYRCRFCGYNFPAWLPVAKRPNGAMLLNHLSAMHREELRPLLARMAAGGDIDAVVVKAYKVVEDQDGAA